MLIDGGLLPFRTGSTVLDLTCDPPVFVREGPVRFDRLYELLEGKLRRLLT
jgi:tRNA A37 threonylcarbamoyladenosine synthetase subunit TsaC/SUA5/YrdC